MLRILQSNTNKIIKNILLLQRQQKYNLTTTTTNTKTKNEIKFDSNKVIQDSARFELETQQQPNGQQIQDKLYDLSIKLDNQSPFNESEKSMMIMMSLADLNLKYKNIDLAKSICFNLIQHLELYQNNNMAFYQYLTPNVLFRQAMILEHTISLENQNQSKNQSSNNNLSLKQKETELINIYTNLSEILEEYKQYSETLIEENIHLQGKVYEKLGNYYKKEGNNQQAIIYYKKGVELGKEIYHKQSIYQMKMNCFLGDLLSRSKTIEDQLNSVQYLEYVIRNIIVNTPQDAQLFSISATSLLKVQLNHINIYPSKSVQDIISFIENNISIIDQKNQLLITPITKSILLNMKAQNLLNLNDNVNAKLILDQSLSIALSIFPQNHPFVQNIFQQMLKL